MLSKNITIRSVVELSALCNDIYANHDSLFPLYKDHKISINFDYSSFVSFSDLNYKRNLICTNEYVDIYLICWKANQKSKIHDHPEKGCVMYVLDGELKENVYEFDKDGNKTTYKFSRILKNNDSSYNFGSTILHQIVAQSDTISLHVYCSGYLPQFYDF